MLWSTRHEGENIFQLVRINDRILLKFKRKSYLSRVEDMKNGELYVAAPLDHGMPVNLGPGLDLCLSAFVGAGLRQFNCKVKTTLYDRVTQVVLNRFKDIGASQQRNYDRIQDCLPVRFRKDDGTGAGNNTPWRQAITCDISGGGIQIVAEDVWLFKEGDLVEIELAIPTEAPLHSVAQLVRIFDVPGKKSKSQFALSFLEIDETDRDRLIKYARQRKAELSSTRNTFIRCTDKVTILYKRKSLKEESLQWKCGAAYDMSASGFRMIVDDVSGLLVGQQLEISLTLPGPVTVEGLCEIAWIRLASDEHAGKHEAGIRFSVFFADGRQTILNFLSRTTDGTKERDKQAA